MSMGTVRSQAYHGDLSSLADLYHIELLFFEVPGLLIPQPERFSFAFPPWSVLGDLLPHLNSLFITFSLPIGSKPRSMHAFDLP
jgi:hypothetical protein